MRQRPAEFWYTTYPTYRRPAPDRLARALADKYPGQDLQWADALTRRRPRWAGDTYWRPVVVPVHWVVSYPDSAELPDLASTETQERWLAGQAELQTTLSRMRLPAEQFRWAFRTENITFDDGVIEPAIVVDGQTTVCCVLRGVGAAENRFLTTMQYKKQSWTDSFSSFFCFAL